MEEGTRTTSLATGTQVCSPIFSERNVLQESTHPNAGGRREEQADAGREGSHLAPLASLQGLQSLQVGICSKLSIPFYNNTSQTDVAPWCYMWTDGRIGLDGIRC